MDLIEIILLLNVLSLIVTVCVCVCVFIEENDVSEERAGSEKCDVAESVEQDFDVEGLRDEVIFFF